jgi:archaemetzincin
LARKRVSKSEKSHVEIIPLGQVDASVLSIIAANLQTVLGLNSDTRPALPDPENAFLPLRGQYSAGKILKDLESVSGGARFKLGVVQQDLCTPILKFVFGESQLGGKAAVISLHRLAHEDSERLYQRAAKIGLHETAHLLGIGHCRALGCLMDPSLNLEKLDTLPLRFCSACEYEIGRILKQTFNRS